MRIDPLILDGHGDMTAWRHHLHRHPELSYREHDTSAFVAERLREFGVEVTTGVGGTGVVGTLDGDGRAGPTLGLRADMDALAIHEANDVEHRSVNDGVMHACGHDGHTAMLLGAARVLAGRRAFPGRVTFVFQPAEEMGGEDGGAARMIREGLFERFPCDAIFGMHNWPGMARGAFAAKAGPMMASGDGFEIRVRGTGMHAAQPHRGGDAVLAASQVVVALQQVTSRGTDPLEAVVVSVTQVHGGDAYNVLPPEVSVRGTVRAFDPAAREATREALHRVVRGTCEAAGVEVEIDYERQYPTLVNEPGAVARALAAADGVFDRVLRDPPRTMIVEDFAFMLEGRPGCYGWIGNGDDAGGRILHSPHYDFDDAVLPLGAAWFVALAEGKSPER